MVIVTKIFAITGKTLLRARFHNKIINRAVQWHCTDTVLITHSFDTVPLNSPVLSGAKSMPTALHILWSGAYINIEANQSVFSSAIRDRARCKRREIIPGWSVHSVDILIWETYLRLVNSSSLAFVLNFTSENRGNTCIYIYIIYFVNYISVFELLTTLNIQVTYSGVASYGALGHVPPLKF